MYSVVLLAAMTAGGQTPDWHRGNSYSSCYGNYGIDDSWGSCWGSCNGCWGSYSSCNGLYPWDWSSSGCNGCLGADSAVMSPYFVQSPAAVPPSAAPPVQPGEALPPPAKPDDKKPETVAPNRARLIVDLPTDAKLFVDDTAMKTPLGHRTYQTPVLEPNQTYYYQVRVEMVRDGKTVSETKRVEVKAGDEARADFTDLASTTTAQAK